LARDPQRRYQTPREVAQALAPFTTQFAPLPVRPIRKPAEPSRSKRSTDEDTRLDDIFKNLAAVEAAHPLTVSGITTRLQRASPRFWLAGAGIVLALAAAFFLWERLSAATVSIDWPIGEADAIRSDADRAHPPLAALRR
jgi:hypothetical protein